MRKKSTVKALVYELARVMLCLLLMFITVTIWTFSILLYSKIVYVVSSVGLIIVCGAFAWTAQNIIDIAMRWK